MAASKIYHVTTSPIGSPPYFERDVLMKGSLFSPAIGDIVIVDENTTYVNTTANSVTGRYYYSIVG